MNTTTDHPKARIVEQTLLTLSRSCLTDWQPNGRRAKPYGIPEILAEITSYDTLTFILTSRALDEAGLDVWWNDLVCQSGTQAADAVLKVAEAGVDFEHLYGPGFQAILGIIEAGMLMHYNQVAALAVNIGHSHEQDYKRAREYARTVDRERMLDRVLTDVQLSGHRAIVFSPSHLQRHLLGVRALELAAAYYVLVGADADFDEEYGFRLLEPMRAYLFPEAPTL